jgi:hypothetical protein
LGTIKVVYSLVKPTGHKQKITKWNAKYEPTILHERSKKAIGHSVQYGFLLGIGLGAASDPLFEDLDLNTTNRIAQGRPRRRSRPSLRWYSDTGL